MIVVCDYCGNNFKKRPSSVGKRNYCIRQCYWKDKQTTSKGKNNSFYGKKHSLVTKEKLRKANTGRKHERAWNSGLSNYKNKGIPRVTINGKRILLSHHVWLINNVGEIILKSEVIHHRDLNPYNNDISNLEKMDNIEHKKLHARLMKKFINKQ